MATTSKATQPKRTTKTTTKSTTTTTDTTALQAQVTTLQSQVETLTSQVTNLTAALDGRDIDGDGIPDVAGLKTRVDNIVNFLKRKWGQGPMEQNGIT